MISLDDMLTRGRKVTEMWQDKGGNWSVLEQLVHVHSEVSEVYEALRHGESKERVLEEVSDIFYSALTLVHLLNGVPAFFQEVTDDDFKEALAKKLEVIERRAKQ